MLLTVSYTLHIPCADLTEKRVEKVKEQLQEIFQEALCNRPSLLIFDDIDLLVPGNQEQEVIEWSNHLTFRRYYAVLSWPNM